VGQTIVFCGLFAMGRRPAKFHEKTLLAFGSWLLAKSQELRAKSPGCFFDPVILRRLKEAGLALFHKNSRA
jgi:hypothetical protein